MLSWCTLPIISTTMWLRRAWLKMMLWQKGRWGNRQTRNVNHSILKRNYNLSSWTVTGTISEICRQLSSVFSLTKRQLPTGSRELRLWKHSIWTVVHLFWLIEAPKIGITFWTSTVCLQVSLGSFLPLVGMIWGRLLKRLGWNNLLRKFGLWRKVYGMLISMVELLKR